MKATISPSNINTRPFRITLAGVFGLAIALWVFSSMIGQNLTNTNGVSLAAYNLSGLAGLLPIMAWYALGIVVPTYFMSAYFIGKLMGQSFRANMRNIVIHNNDDSVVILADYITIGVLFTALAVPPTSPLIYLTFLASKIVFMLAWAILVSVIRLAPIMWVSGENYRWFELDKWFVYHMRSEGSDMVSRIVGTSFQYTGLIMFGIWILSK